MGFPRPEKSARSRLPAPSPGPRGSSFPSSAVAPLPSSRKRVDTLFFYRPVNYQTIQTIHRKFCAKLSEYSDYHVGNGRVLNL